MEGSLFLADPLDFDRGNVVLVSSFISGFVDYKFYRIVI